MWRWNVVMGTDWMLRKLPAVIVAVTSFAGLTYIALNEQSPLTLGVGALVCCVLVTYMRALARAPYANQPVRNPVSGTLEERVKHLAEVGEWQEKEFENRYWVEAGKGERLGHDTGAWWWDIHPTKQVVVCAAVRYGKLVIPCVRHTSVDRQTLLKLIGADVLRAYHGKISGEQGFLDNYSRFLTRKEAYSVAVAAGQIIPGTTPQPGTLFSEDLYP